MACLHPSFTTHADVHAVATPTGHIIGYQLSARVNCAICGVPFHFPNMPDVAALPPHNDVVTKPMTLLCGMELKMPIKPGPVDYGKN